MKSPSDGSRGKQIRSTLLIVNALLLGKRLTRHDVCTLLGCKPAAADRQLHELRAVKGVRHENGETFFDQALLFDPASYTAAVSACLMAGLSRLFRGTAYERGMNAALKVVVERQTRRVPFKHLERKFIFAERGGETSLPEAHGMLDDLIEAILKQTKVHIRYTDFSGSRKEAVAEPLSLVIFEHQLYAIIRRSDEQIRAVRFSRIRHLTTRAEHFDYPPTTTYDLTQLFSQVFGIFIGPPDPLSEIELRFHERWRTYADTHQWHPSQKVVPGKGPFTVRMTLRPCPQFEAWLLGFGADVEVIEPKFLRDRISDTLKKAAQVYALRTPVAPANDNGETPRRRAAPPPRPRPQRDGLMPRRSPNHQKDRRS
jgi:predicted DNA-binding transcriptional regulator YafY